MFPDPIQSVIDRVDLRATVDDHWQIPREEALLLAQLVSIGRFVSICEIGTSYGFSTLHLAAAAACGTRSHHRPQSEESRCRVPKPARRRP